MSTLNIDFMKLYGKVSFNYHQISAPYFHYMYISDIRYYTLSHVAVITTFATKI